MFTDCYATQFRRTSNALTRIYDDALRPVGLRITQFSLLRSLGRLGEATLTQLASESALDKTTMSRNVQLLVDAGWVDVSASEDRRIKLLSLSPSGAAIIETAMPHWRRAQDLIDAETDAVLASSTKNRLLSALESLQNAALAQIGSD